MGSIDRIGRDYGGGTVESLDLRLLKVFDEIYRTGSVSRAAANIGLTQPSLSIALGKLRRHFDDPLFVRTAAGMQPTPYAAELVELVRDGLGKLEIALRHRPTFDPARADRRFTLCFTDISQAVLLPRLLAHVKQAAPRVGFDIVPISEATPHLLQTGEADLAIGFMPQLEAGFYQQTLFEQRFVCVVRADHPRIRSRLTLKQFTAEEHIVVTASATGHWILDRTLEQHGIRRTVALRLPDFLGVGTIVGASDLLVTVPERLGRLMQQAAQVKMLAPPIALPTYAVKQHWHERYHHDPATRWLRGVFAALFVERGGRAVAQTANAAGTRGV
jgi:DNA-binding transcriptional LysR family regulator